MPKKLKRELVATLFKGDDRGRGTKVSATEKVIGRAYKVAGSDMLEIHFDLLPGTGLAMMKLKSRANTFASTGRRRRV